MAKCKMCNKELTITKGYQHTTFCSHECNIKWLKRNNEIHACATCGGDVEVNWKRKRPSSPQKNYFCSTECYNTHRSVEKILHVCKECGKSFLVRVTEKASIFCSRTCYSRYRNRPVTIQCAYCGKDKLLPYTQVKKTLSNYCNIECYNLARGFNSNSKVWRNNRGRLIKAINYNIWKVHILDRDNYTCVKCNKELTTSTLVVHHKISLRDVVKRICDPDIYISKEDIQLIINDNLFKDEENGEVLCRSCHAKEHSPSIK